VGARVVDLLDEVSGGGVVDEESDIEEEDDVVKEVTAAVIFQDICKRRPFMILHGAIRGIPVEFDILKQSQRQACCVSKGILFEESIDRRSFWRISITWSTTAVVKLKRQQLTDEERDEPGRPMKMGRTMDELMTDVKGERMFFVGYAEKQRLSSTCWPTDSRLMKDNDLRTLGPRPPINWRQ
jgi:hypothetical protein